MKTFDELWYSNEYRHVRNNPYDKASAKFGWELALKYVLQGHQQMIHAELNRMAEEKRLEQIAQAYKRADELEAEGNYDLARMYRPCCPNEKRDNNGGCISCGSPCF